MKVKYNRKTKAVELRPNFGSYKHTPYQCDVQHGFKFWQDHLIESKFWFKSDVDMQVDFCLKFPRNDHI
tara:strand:- start:206 stop:412 length:207 start_codon:yes stop_codon:yes gene_type:complete